MLTFNIPRNLRDLERERIDELRVVNVPDFNSAGHDDVDAAYDDCISALTGGPLSILNQQAFDDAYTIVRSLELLDVGHAAKLATTMSQNLTVLVTSGLEELSVDGRDKGDPAVTSHRSAIHAYVFFLSVIHGYFHTRALEIQKAEASTKVQGPTMKKRGKAKATANEDLGVGLTAVWPGIMERIVKVLARTLKANLDGVLYRSPVDKCRLIEVCILTVARCMEDSSIAKQKGALTACLEVAVLSATRHANVSGCLELMAEALFRLVMEQEHGRDLAIQAAVLAAGQHDSLSLGKALVMKFSELDPEGYDDIASHDTKPVKRAAEMLTCMAIALPAVLHANISQLIPYFGCKTAVTIRSNLVACMEHLMKWYMARGMDEKGSRQLQISRQNAVQILVSRVNDAAALVRKAALNAMEGLAECKCWPIEYIVVAARAAVARLDDGALPAGAALSLLSALVRITATEKLTDTFLVSSLNRFEEHLKGMQPDVVEGEDGQDDGPQWEKGTLGDNDTKQQEQEEGQRQQQPGASETLGPFTQQGVIMPTQVDDGAGPAPIASNSGRGQDNSGGNVLGGMTYSQVRLLVASLKAFLELSRTLAAALPEVEALLTSDSSDVAKMAIQLLTLCSQKQLQGVADSWRRVWHMVFSTSEKVRETVHDAFYNFLLPRNSVAGLGGQHRYMVNKLVQMVDDLALCDEEALEELIRLAVIGTKPEESPVFGPELVRMILGDLNAAVIRATLLEREGPSAATEARETRVLAGRLSLICSMITRHSPKLVAYEVENLVANLKRSHTVLKDVQLVRNLARMLGDIAHALPGSFKEKSGGATYQPPSHIRNALVELLSVLVSSHLPQRGGSWPPAAQAALAAIYSLHPEPHTLLLPLIQRLAKDLGDGRAPAALIARAIFLVGCVATQQLAMIDRLVKRVRQERAAQEKKAAEKASPDDMDAQLGTGQAREHQLDALHEQLEANLMSNSLITAWGKLVSELCHTPALLGLDPELASAAMTTLAKFMTIDATYCEDNCPIFFTRLTGGSVKLAPRVRCGMLVALGDLGRRHPNIMEPWTERMFVCLNDDNEEVATTCLRVLAHLILSDMTKPKGHMAHVARCLVSPSAAVRDLAIRLFNSLSKKQAKGGANKVYQYLPEIISTVTRGDPMPEQDFKEMMQRLLGYVKADKLADKLKERLCERFQNVVCKFSMGIQVAATPTDAKAIAGGEPATGPLSNPSPSNSDSSYEQVVQEWRSLADCISLIPYSEKGLRACIESMRCYKHALGDEHVYQVFKSIAEHGRRGNRSAELKQEVVEYEARLHEAHTSLREEQRQQAAVAAAEAEAVAVAKAAAAAEVIADAAFTIEGPAKGCPKQQGSIETVNDAEDGAQQPDQTQQPVGTSVVINCTLSREVGEDEGPRQDGSDRGEGINTAAESIPADVHNDDEEMVSAEESDTEDSHFEDVEGEEPDEEETLDRGGMPEEETLDGEEQEQWEEAAEEGEEEEQAGKKGEEEVSAFTDAEMEWEEDSVEGTPAKPLGERDSCYNTVLAVAFPGTCSPTPMAITPAPLKAGRGEDGNPDNMAWSPAPSCAPNTATAAMSRAEDTQQENKVPLFPGFSIKPDPDGHQQGLMWPTGSVAGVRVKSFPDSPWQG